MAQDLSFSCQTGCPESKSKTICLDSRGVSGPRWQQNTMVQLSQFSHSINDIISNHFFIFTKPQQYDRDTMGASAI